MVCCIYARRHNTQYQTIQHACGPWLLQRFSSPYRRSLHKEIRQFVRVWSSKQVQISPETNNETQPKTTLHVPGQLWFSCAFFSIWLNGWRFSANSSASSWQPACRSASYIYRRACCISFSVWCVSGDSVVSWWECGLMCWWSVSIAQVRLGGVWASMHA